MSDYHIPAFRRACRCISAKHTAFFGRRTDGPVTSNDMPGMYAATAQSMIGVASPKSVAMIETCQFSQEFERNSLDVFPPSR